MKFTDLSLASLVALSALSVAPAQVTIEWVGTNGAWENPLNWQTTQIPIINRLPVNGDRIDLPINGSVITISNASGTQSLDQSDAVQRATANVKIIQTGGTINIDQFLLSSTKAAVANGHVNYELRGGTLYSDYRSTFTWDNSSDRASRFVQTGGSSKWGATTNHGIQMAQKASTQQAYFDLKGGTFDCGYLKVGTGGSDQTAVFTQTGSSAATIRGTLHLGTVAGTTGQSIYNLHGGTLTMSETANPFAFTQPGAPVYFDFRGGVLNLRGTWSLASLTAIPNADFRVHGAPATIATLLFAPITIGGQPYTRVFECTAFATNYGPGLAGQNGIPTLQTSAVPQGGTTILVSASNSAGIATPGLLVVGTEAPWISILGGQLLVAPLLEVGVAVPTAGWTVPYPVPRGICQTFYLQLLQLDPAASQGVSMTPGLQLTLGN